MQRLASMRRVSTSKELTRSPSGLSHCSSSTKPERRSSISASFRRLSSSNLIRRLSGSPMNPEIPSVPPPLSPQLQNALHLLRFHDLDDLERHFLSTDAFLTPWAHFRDHCLLQVKNGMTEDASKGDINKMDILYWYTHYDEGRRRYDPAFDEEKHGCASEMNRENYGMIDTSNWTDLEYKKLLYVWLLQTFQVGKSFNAHNFQYFELRNICTAWENVFVPIVAAVRADYNPKGRYHYGRLARFIEAARPSKLAFPDPNMSTSPLKHTPAKSLGFTTTPDLINDPAMVVDPVTGVVTRTQNKVWDEEDRELREAFAKYGQLVERPKAKEKVEMWLKEQHALCQRRRALEHLDNGAKETSITPVHHASGNISEEFPEDCDVDPRAQAASSPRRMHRRNESNYSNVSTTVPPNGPDGTWQQRKSAERLYSLIRTSNPWNDDDVFGPEPTHNGKSSQISDRSGMMQIEVKPSPLDTPFSVNPKPRPDPSELNPSEPTTHRPSYEGTAFGSTPLPTLKEMKSTERVRQTRIPSPITIPPYETSRKYHPLVERAVSLAETSPVSSEPPPIVPLKDPKRWSSPHGHVQRSHSVQLAHEECSPGPRIVSKENIRAALGDLSRETSAESLREDDVRGGGIRKTSNGSVGDKHAFARMGGRGLNTGESLAFPTFNTHMFPRNQTPARGQKKT